MNDGKRQLAAALKQREGRERRREEEIRRKERVSERGDARERALHHASDGCCASCCRGQEAALGDVSGRMSNLLPDRGGVCRPHALHSDDSTARQPLWAVQDRATTACRTIPGTQAIWLQGGTSAVVQSAQSEGLQVQDESAEDPPAAVALWTQRGLPSGPPSLPQQEGNPYEDYSATRWQGAGPLQALQDRGRARWC